MAFVNSLIGRAILLETSMDDEDKAHYVLKFSLILLLIYNILFKYFISRKIFLQYNEKRKFEGKFVSPLVSFENYIVKVKFLCIMTIQSPILYLLFYIQGTEKVKQLLIFCDK